MAKKRDLNTLSKEELIQIIQEYEAELERVNGTMRLIISRNIFLEDELKKYVPIDSTEKYNQSWSWVSKIVYAVEKLGRPVQNNEIASFLEKTDENFKYYSAHSRLNNLAVQLTRAVRYKRLIAHKIPGLKSPYYCLPEWYNEKGELLEEFKFKPNFK